MENLKQKLLSLDIFIDNEYLDFYCTLIFNNLNNIKEKGVTQGHHFIPVCYYKNKYGCPNYLSARKYADKDPYNMYVYLDIVKHVQAHYYLYKCVVESYKYKFLTPLCRMLGFTKGEINNPEFLTIINETTIKELYKEWCTQLSIYQRNKQHKNSKKYIDYVHSLGGKTLDELQQLISRDSLINYWLRENHTFDDTARHYNISATQLCLILKKYNIPSKKNKNKMRDLYQNYSYEYLYQLYIENNLTAAQVADKLSLDEDTVFALLRHYQIRKINSGKTPETFSQLLKRVDKNSLYTYYVVENHTQFETMRKYKLCLQSLYMLLENYSINKAVEMKVVLEYDEVFKYYIRENHTHKECLKYFGVGGLKFDTFVKQHGLNKSNYLQNIKKKIKNKIVYY